MALNLLCRPAPRALSSRLLAYCRPAYHETQKVSSSTPCQAHLRRCASTSPQPLRHTPDQHAVSELSNTSISYVPLSQTPASLHDPTQRPEPDRPLFERHGPNPVGSESDDLAAWLPAIESELPRNMHDPVESSSRLSQVLRILSDIERSRNTSVMADVGFEGLMSWDAVESLLKRAVDETKSQALPLGIEDLVLSVPSPDSQSLDQMIDTKTHKEWREKELLEHFVPQRDNSESNLHRMTESFHDKRHTEQSKVGSDVWYGVGSIIRRSISTPGNATPMRVALEVLKYLDQHGQMPWEDLSESQRHSRAGSAINFRSLLDNQNASGQVGTTGAVHSPPSCAAWFELVLWACLLSGRVTEASTLLIPSGRPQGKEGLLFTSGTRWDLIDGSASNSESFRGDVEVASARAAEKAYISEEVITAIVDAILCDISSVHNRPGRKPKRVLGSVKRLRKLSRMLQVSNQSLAGLTWSCVVADLLGNGMPSTMRGTRHMADLLRMACGQDQPDGSSQRASSETPGYIFDSSAAMIGLYHQAIDKQVKGRDVQGAVSSLEGLQDFIKTNRERLAEESAQLENSEGGGGSRTLPNNDSNADSPQPHISERGGHTLGSIQIPPMILAGLLDLVTETEMEHVGNRMIYTDDIDGPLIGAHLYGHAKVAPALVRYATATNDMTLLSAVAKVQDSQMAGETLVALCHSYATSANWTGVTRLVGLCRRFSLHQWRAEDVAFVSKALIAHIHDPLEQGSAIEAALMLQRFLSGDILKEVGPPVRDLRDLAAVLSSLDRNMSSICHGLTRQDYRRRAKTSIESFNILLEGIARTYGALRAQDMYTEWCTDNTGTQRRATRQRLSDSSDKSSTIAKLFGKADTLKRNQAESQVADRRLSHVAAIQRFTPNLATIRIVIAQALKESHSLSNDYVATTVDEGLPKVRGALMEAESLEWASRILRRDFGMNYSESNYELQGYLRAKAAEQSDDGTHETAYYRNRTLIAWLIASEEDAAWTAKVEDEMRTFALDKSRHEIYYQSVDAKQSRFVESLADDFGLTCEATDKGPARGVVVRKLAAIKDHRLLVPTARVAQEAKARFAI